MTLKTLNYGNYGIFLIMGNAGFCPSTVWPMWGDRRLEQTHTFRKLRTLTTVQRCATASERQTDDGRDTFFSEIRSGHKP